MTPAQAAVIIGCCKQQVRTLIRNGKLKAARRRSRNNQHGYIYIISREEAVKYRDRPIGRGRPRSNDPRI